MKSILKYILAALCAVLALSCDRDDETLIATLGSDTTISTLDTDIILSATNGSALALTIYWDELGTVSLNNPDAQISSDVLVNAVQFSLTQDFAAYSEKTVDNDAMSVQLTVSELNVIMSNLGAEGGVANTVYIRLRTTLGDNGDPSYSNVITVNITPYTIDMSYITMSGVSAGSYTGTDVTIPAVSDGEYEGFAHIASEWWNCFFVEGDGTIWGSDESNGPFIMDQKSDISSWNIWFPSPSGCYYIDISTNNAEWNCQNITAVSLTAGSEAAVEMTYSKSNVAYWLVFTTTTDNAALEVSYTGGLYNSTTGDSSPVSVEFPFVASSDGSFAVGASGTSTGITAGTAGTYTLAFYMETQTWQLSEGNVEIGGDDGSSWNQDDSYVAATTDVLYMYDKDGNVLTTLASTSTGVYEGYYYMTGWLNFNFGDNADSSAATVIYGSHPTSDDGALYRLYCSADKWAIWWDFETAAYVRLTVDTNERSWTYTEITDIDIVGIGDVWTANTYPMTLGTDGLWTEDVTLTNDTLWGPWGIQFLVNENWSYAYAPGTGGTLALGNAATPEGTFTQGTTYTVTVDLANMTYSIEEATEGGDESGEDTGSSWGEDASYVAATTDNLYMYDTSGNVLTTLASTSTGVYEGYYYMTGWLTFNFGDNADYSSATVIYGSYPSGDDGALYRLYCSDGKYSIWWDFDTAAYVRLTVDTNERSWSYTEITDVDIVGIGDNWNADVYPMTLGTDGLWTETVTLTNDTLWGPWGIQFLVNANWDYAYAPGTGGTLALGNAATPEGTFTQNSTYTVTVDLANMTYSIADVE